MQYPKGDRGLYARFAKWLFDFYKKVWVQYFLAPLILAAFPAIASAFYSNQVFKSAVLKAAPSVGNFLIDYVIVVIITACLYPTLLLVFAKSIVKKVDGRSVNVEGLLALMASLDEVVGCKAERFGKLAANPGGLTGAGAFCAITQPQLQIAENIRGIATLFNALKTDKKGNLIKVVLVAMDQGKVSAVPIHYPYDEPVGTSLEILSQQNSGIMTAARTKKIVIISSIERELKKAVAKRRFAESDAHEENTGSLICYPVVHNETRSVPFVISIHSDEPGYFKDDFTELYKHALQRFSLRLSLEYSLLLLKEKICEPSN